MLGKTAKKIKKIKKIKKRKNISGKQNLISLSVIMAAVTLIFSFTAKSYSGHQITVSDSGETYSFFTNLTSPDEILTAQGIRLNKLDYVEFGGFNANGDAEIEIRRSVKTVINVDGNVISTEARDNDKILDVLTRENIFLNDCDTAIPNVNTFCKDALNSVNSDENSEKFIEILVFRAPTVTLKIGKDTREIKFSPEKLVRVWEILEKAEIQFGEEDLADVPLSRAVFDGMEINLNLVRYADKSETELVSYTCEDVYSNLYPIGKTFITQEGQNGRKQIVKREKYVNDILENREIISEETTTEMSPQITVHGSALKTPYSDRDFPAIKLENGLPVNYQKIISGKASAYTASSGAGTASGRKLQIGTVAVNPKIIPYGTLLYIVSSDHRHLYGAAVAADTGSFTDILLDLYMGTTVEHYNDACAWGVKNVDIYVIGGGY